MRDVNRRISALEILLEHPDIHGVSRPNPGFPSPAVTVVMPTWDRADVVGAAVRSVQAQRFSDWELIVVDDGSTDNTAEIMAEFVADARVRYVVLPHGGQCIARNHALRLAKGALVAYLDSDNVWYPDFLAAAVSLFAARADVDCAYGAMVTDAHARGERILFQPFDRNLLLLRNFIGMSTFVHRRELFERYGGFDEALDSLEDWDMVLRYTAHAPAYRLPILAVRYRVVDDKRMSVVARVDKSKASIYDKWK
jgi:glycosyltransferase involved in cell wall biosynthesis